MAKTKTLASRPRTRAKSRGRVANRAADKAGKISLANAKNKSGGIFLAPLRRGFFYCRLLKEGVRKLL